MTGRPVRIGVLGCADIAVRKVLPAIASLPGADVAAVASRDAARAGRVAERYGCAAVGGYERLLRRDDVDAVYVPLPAALRPEWVERALRAGKHVLAEKPVATRAADTAALADLAGSSGLVLMENIMFLHHGAHARLRRLVEDGAIGEPRCLEAAFAIPPRPADDIRYRPDLGGGALLDVGVYPLRAAQFLLGPRWEVLGAGLLRDPGRGVDTAGAVLLRNPAGVTAQLTFGMVHSYRSAYTLWGSEGRLHLDRAFTPPPDHRPTARLERSDGRRDLELEAEDQCAAAVRAFADAVRAQGPGPWDRWPHDSVALARLVDEVRRAARRADGPPEPTYRSV
ncbi:Gfo/Idh/MocA family protein [Streptomyces sp. SS8]